MRRFAALLLLTLAARPALAQSEDALRTAFEGKTVLLKIEMPGSEQGVDLYPGTSRVLDVSRHASRLKQFGSAYHPGDVAIVTKLHVKGDHIEFQLGGGGFGTMGDNTSTTVDVTAAPKTQREKDLEQQVKTVTDPVDKRRMSSELDDLRSARQREDSRNQARAAQASAIKEANVMQKRLQGGSRFNINFDKVVPPTALTPSGLAAILGDYLDISPPPAGTALAPAGGDLKKGMSVDDVDAIMGRPESITSRQEGTLTVSTSTYRSKDRKVMAEFVEGVMFRFSVVSQ